MSIFDKKGDAEVARLEAQLKMAKSQKEDMVEIRPGIYCHPDMAELVGESWDKTNGIRIEGHLKRIADELEKMNKREHWRDRQGRDEPSSLLTKHFLVKYPDGQIEHRSFLMIPGKDEICGKVHIGKNGGFYEVGVLVMDPPEITFVEHKG